MININNKRWDKLRFSDVEKLLSNIDDETFFFEFKADDETPAKLIKEISAFANTYGGYIFLGVNDDKSIGGCTKWTEQRIHTTIHDSITPIPNFDVKKFKSDGKVIYIIKIEEGTMPPYITNKGTIYERVSSGSFLIKDSAKLAQLYQKRKDELIRTKNKIELNDIDLGGNHPNNLCGYLDLGFSVTCSEHTRLQKNFYVIDLNPIAEHIRTVYKNRFSIARVGHSYLFSLGEVDVTDQNGNKRLPDAGINNYMEVMPDGSIRSRVVLASNECDSKADITVFVDMHKMFADIYSMIFGKGFSKKFVYAHKYERLTVFKQFIPYYDFEKFGIGAEASAFSNYLTTHKNKYGNNLIIDSNRVPKNDYTLIDHRYFDESKIRYDDKHLISELFDIKHFNLGYIDQLNL